MASCGDSTRIRAHYLSVQWLRSRGRNHVLAGDSTMDVIQGPRWLGAVLLVVTSSVGCGSAPGAGQERFIPTTTTARAAVESALKAWQRGEPAGELKGSQPPIFVAD